MKEEEVSDVMWSQETPYYGVHFRILSLKPHPPCLKCYPSLSQSSWVRHEHWGWGCPIMDTVLRCEGLSFLTQPQFVYTTPHYQDYCIPNPFEWAAVLGLMLRSTFVNHLSRVLGGGGGNVVFTVADFVTARQQHRASTACFHNNKHKVASLRNKTGSNFTWNVPESYVFTW